MVDSPLEVAVHSTRSIIPLISMMALSTLAKGSGPSVLQRFLIEPLVSALRAMWNGISVLSPSSLWPLTRSLCTMRPTGPEPMRSAIAVTSSPVRLRSASGGSSSANAVECVLGSNRRSSLRSVHVFGRGELAGSPSRPGLPIPISTIL